MAITRRFIADTNGNFAIIASVVSIPLLLAVGLAVDYYNLARVQTEMQNAVDSAVLAVAHEGDKISLTNAQVLADRFVRENFSLPYTDLSVTMSGTNVNVSAKVRAPLSFGGILGFPSIDFTKRASSAVYFSNYEIALVLDTTGSMAGGKIAAMKDAVIGLIDTMAAQNARAGSLKFSLVPFSSKVNVGAQFGPAYSAAGAVTRMPAAWLDTMAQSPITQNDLDPGVSRFVMMRRLNTTWEGCVEARASSLANSYDVNDEAPNEANPESLFVPAFASDEPDSGPYPNSYLSDNPVKIGNGTPYARMERYGATYPATFKALSFADQVSGSATWPAVPTDYSNQTYYGGYPVPKGPNFGCDVQPIVPLTDNFMSLKTKVNGLMALGSTNILEGAVWGWRTLSSREPFSEGRPESDIGVQKILVLLTDGTNNLGQIGNALGSSHSAYGYLADGRLGINSGTATQITDAMNAKTLQACANAKADGIEIYTIRLEEPNVTTGNMLRDCATDADHYVDVPNRALLDSAFEKIKDRIARIRLAS